MKRLFRRMVLPVALLTGVGASATVLRTFDDPIPAVNAQTVPAEAGPAALSAAFRNASSAALDGVVHIQVREAARPASQENPFEGTPFEDFFGGARPNPGPRVGSGSGFIISPDGYVMTNNHVVEGATDVMVTLTDGRQFEAEVVGRDPSTDVAVIKIDGENLPTVDIGDSDSLVVGDWVLALGYPLQLGETVTAGIVSAMGRNIGIIDSNTALEHFIQTDAAINPGNSGGPLVNLRGQVVGINSAIASPTGAYTGYGFAVPITLAKRVADDLMQYGNVHRPRLGVQISDASQADVEVFGLPNANGAVVRGVQDGPARDAGVQLGDVIVAVDGQPIQNAGDLMERVALRRPGEDVTLDLIRYGDEKKVDLELGMFETGEVAEESHAEPARDAVARLGFAASDMTPEIANELGIESTEGVVITRVDPAGSAPGDIAGLRVERLNGQEIHSVDDLRSAASDLETGDVVSIVGLLPNGDQTIINYRLRD